MSVHFINRRRKYLIEIEIGIGIEIEKTLHSMWVGCANMFFSSFGPQRGVGRCRLSPRILPPHPPLRAPSPPGVGCCKSPLQGRQANAVRLREGGRRPGEGLSNPTAKLQTSNCRLPTFATAVGWGEHREPQQFQAVAFGVRRLTPTYPTSSSCSPLPSPRFTCRTK